METNNVTEAAKVAKAVECSFTKFGFVTVRFGIVQSTDSVKVGAVWRTGVRTWT